MPPLPGWQDALIPIEKFAGYSMLRKHPKNRDKWRAYDRLGYDIWSDDGRRLSALDVIDQLRRALPMAETTPWRRAKPGDESWDVRITIVGPNETHGTLHTGWQMAADGRPRLVTNWVEVHGRRSQA